MSEFFFLYVYIYMFIQDPRSMQDVLFKFIIQYLDIHLCAHVQIIFPFIQDVYDLKKRCLQMDIIKQMHFFMQIKKMFVSVCFYLFLNFICNITVMFHKHFTFVKR